MYDVCNKSKPVNDYYEPMMDSATTIDGVVKKFWKQKRKEKNKQYIICYFTFGFLAGPFLKFLKSLHNYLDII